MRKIFFEDRGLFLTHAVLDGSKTMERGIVVGQPEFDDYRINQETDQIELLHNGKTVATSMYATGEVMAVAQSYEEAFSDEEAAEKFLAPTGQRLDHLKTTLGWTNKMCTSACVLPHRVRITGMGVQRLQDISDDDCIREGVLSIGSFNGPSYVAGPAGVDVFKSPKEAYECQCKSVFAPGTWRANPWVWVYTFKLVK